MLNIIIITVHVTCNTENASKIQLLGTETVKDCLEALRLGNMSFFSVVTERKYGFVTPIFLNLLIRS